MMAKREVKAVSAEEAWLASLDARIAAEKRGAKKAEDKQAAAAVRVERAPVIAMARPHPATLAVDVLLRDCVMGKSKSGGPGGQNRNKVETTVTLTHMPSGVETHAGERRTSMENKRMALMRLRLALAVQVRCDVMQGDARSALWQSRCKNEKIVVSTSHEDFPAMLAEALDCVYVCDMDPKVASARLCCSLSQLIKLMKDHPPAFVWVNVMRAAGGMRGLK